ncbi:hypothetical protein E2C01_075607 [Portunus trituberculatus]|uniref:Uncharacterized protein n=1 Tax=Portunus trituberculatus TaxID=210409 RepID=A0A5B7IJK5_PORTR|nr:hypothetical protein [Portunus trituberculatus]
MAAPGCHPRWLAPCPRRPQRSTHRARKASQASGGGRRGGMRGRGKVEGVGVRVNLNTSRPRHAAAPTQGRHPLVGSEQRSPSQTPCHAGEGKGEGEHLARAGEGARGGEMEVSGQG